MHDARIIVFAAAVFAVFVACGNAYGVQQFTYVATYGSDANSCSLALPCRSFAGALAQTSDGGEIVVLDSGGYGPVQIDKSVSIVAPEGVYGGVSVFNSGAGVAIIPPAARVRLSGLSFTRFNDYSSAVAITGQAHVYIERSAMTGSLQAANGGVAILLCCEAAAGQLHVVDSTIYANGGGILGVGPWTVVLERTRILSDPVTVFGNLSITGSLFAFNSQVTMGPVANESVRGDVQRTLFSDNGIGGISVQGWWPSPVAVSLYRNVFVRGLTGLDMNTQPGVASAIDVVSCVFTDNEEFGISDNNQDPAAYLTLSANTIVRNGRAGVPNDYGRIIHSRGNNTIRNNGGVNAAPLLPLPGL